MSIQIEPLVELLLESPGSTATNEEFAEWLREQELLQNREYTWKDRLILRDERETHESDGDKDEDSKESGGEGP